MSKTCGLLERFEASAADTRHLSTDDLNTIETEVASIVQSIRQCNDFSEAEQYLGYLGDVQTALARFTFKHGIRFDNRLWKVISEYDRCDLEEVRRDTFNAIKEYQYPWDIHL